MPALRTATAVALAVGLTACMGRAAAPEPGTSQGTPPDLRGSRVMVLPVQDVRGVAGDSDAEIAFALQDREPGVTWVLPRRIQESLDRSPGMNGRIHGLSVGAFSAGEVRRIGDPLYGDLRRLGALVDADVALIPLWAAQVADSAGTTVRLSATLIQVRTGRVLWFGMVEGDAREASDAGALASAVDALARTLLWYSGK